MSSDTPFSDASRLVKERSAPTLPGFVVLPLQFATMAAAIYGMSTGKFNPPLLIASLFLLACVVISVAGYFSIEPNQARALTLFGSYRGTTREAGLRWANPFLAKKPISLRVRNFETQHLKVNDHDGNPIEIAAVVVWHVVDTAQALYSVESYENFVHVQSEAALRNLASRYAYDVHDQPEVFSLRGHTLEVARELQKEIQARLVLAGVSVSEARISHLAYAQEIAQAMLQRQQAGAIVAARNLIVEGAVGMVELALAKLSAREIVHLDEERKAAMVSNLLVVLCSERATSPVVNAGTLYS